MLCKTGACTCTDLAAGCGCVFRTSSLVILPPLPEPTTSAGFKPKFAIILAAEGITLTDGAAVSAAAATAAAAGAVG